MKSKSIYRIYFLFVAAALLFHYVVSINFSDICKFNYGISLGFLSEFESNQNVLLGIVSISVLLSVFTVLRRSGRYSRTTALILLSAIAGFSNLFDRVLHGGVCDYLSIHLGSNVMHLNINDLVLTVNALLILYLFVKKNDH